MHATNTNTYDWDQLARDYEKTRRYGGGGAHIPSRSLRSVTPNEPTSDSPLGINDADRTSHISRNECARGADQETCPTQISRCRDEQSPDPDISSHEQLPSHQLARTELPSHQLADMRNPGFPPNLSFAEPDDLAIAKSSILKEPILKEVIDDLAIDPVKSAIEENNAMSLHDEIEFTQLMKETAEINRYVRSDMFPLDEMINPHWQIFDNRSARANYAIAHAELQRKDGTLARTTKSAFTLELTYGFWGQRHAYYVNFQRPYKFNYNFPAKANVHISENYLYFYYKAMHDKIKRLNLTEPAPSDLMHLIGHFEPPRNRMRKRKAQDCDEQEYYEPNHGRRRIPYCFAALMWDKHGMPHIQIIQGLVIKNLAMNHKKSESTAHCPKFELWGIGE